MEDKESKDSKIIKKTLDQEQTVKAMEKLKKEKIEININPKKFLLNYSKDELKKFQSIDKATLSEKDLKEYDETERMLKESIEKYSQTKLEAVMVPLRYKDLQTIKDGVLEAVKYSKEFGWDDDIRMRAMVREEHTLTIFLSLRKKEDITKRYYATLEEIALETESMIEELYKIYIDNFVLSDIERKNS